MKRVRLFPLAVLVMLPFQIATAMAQNSRSASGSAQGQASALIQEMARTRNLNQWFDENQSKITKDVAAAADRIAVEAISSNRPDIAQAASMFAALAHLRLGERDLALKSMTDQYQIRFMKAEKPEEYAALRKDAVELEPKAVSINRKDLAFNLAVLAADCSYFRSTAQEKDDGKLLIATLQDIETAFPLAGFASERVWLERFVSLTGATIGRATAQYFLTQEELEKQLKKMAPGLEQAIPADFDFTVKNVGTRLKAIEAAGILARYSYRYGNPAVASARLAIAEQRASELHDVGLTLGLIGERYTGERRGGASPQQLRMLRDDAWRRAQELRNGYHSRAGRIWASYSSDKLYGEMLNGALAERSPNIPEVFTGMESLKARMLLDRMSTQNVSEITTTESAGLERQVLGFSEPKPDNGDLTLSELRLISQLSGFSELGDGAARQTSLTGLESLYAKAGAGFKSSADPAALATVQHSLQPREALLEYVIPYAPLHPASDLWMLLITRSAVTIAHVPLDKTLGLAAGFTGRMSVDGEAPIDSSALGSLVLHARTDIRGGSNEKQTRQRLRNLHEVLIQPLIAKGVRLEDFERLVIVPHSMLHYVPFPALIDRQGAYLIAKVPITIAPSASVWKILQSRSNAADRFLAFANPDLKRRGVAELPFADQEVAEIAKGMPQGSRQVYRREAATKDRFFADAPRAGILHLSTHGEFPNDNALDLHAVWLADESTNGAALRASEVRKANLSNASLVALSVCNGGLYRIGPSDEPYGLIPAFIEAGAQNVLGTLWPLDDQFGRDFMIEFYKHLGPDGPALAYQKTCLRFIGEDEFIRRWAGFVLVGPGRPMKRSALLSGPAPASR